MQLLRDESVEPTPTVTAAALDGANNIYTKFLDSLAGRNITVEWRYYNDGKAWLGKGLYKKKTVFWLSIWDGYFCVSVFIPERLRAEVVSLPIDKVTKKKIESSEKIGKLKFFPIIFEVRSEETLDAVYKVIDFKSVIK